VEGSAPALFADLCSTQYPDHLTVFTDGSVMRAPAAGVGVGVVVPTLSLNFPFRLHSRHTILAAELFGILQALIFLSSLPTTTCAVIFTDSLSSLFLLSTSRLSSYSSIVLAIHRNLLLFPLRGVHLQWIPAHCSISGNEAADAVAKEAATSSLPVHDLSFSLTELHSQLSSSIWNYWQVRWTAARGQHCLGIHKPLVRPWAWQGTQSRFFESLFARLRLGTAPLNKSLHRIRQVESPNCPYCQTDETVYHFFFVCPHYSPSRHSLMISLHSLGYPSPALTLLLSGPPGDPRAATVIFKLVEAFITSTHRFDRP
jgi:ribonuclease HI